MSFWQRLDTRLRARWHVSLRQSLSLVALVMGGMAVCVTMFFVLLREQERTLKARVETEALERIELLRSTTLRSLEVLHAIASFMNTEPVRSRQQFHDFVTPSLERTPEVQALEWIARVPKHQRMTYEQAARADGMESFAFSELHADQRPVRAAERDIYYPVYYVEPLARNREAVGLDIASDARRLQALKQAERSGKPTATEPIRLAQETEEGKLGFLVLLPVGETRTEPSSDMSTKGLVLAVFRVPDFVVPAFRSLDASDFQVTVRDPAIAEPLLSLGPDSAEQLEPELLHVGELDLAGRTWTLQFVPTKAFVKRHADSTVVTYPLLGIVLTALMGAYAATNMRRAVEIETKVEERTRELTIEIAQRQQTERALRAAELKYRSMFENSIAGIFQTTPEGSYINANQSLATIYGYASPAEFMTSVSDVQTQLYVDPAQRQRFIDQIREHDKVTDFVSQVYKKDGSVTWISETATAVRRADGSVDYYEGSVQDVSERVRIDELRRQSYEWLEGAVKQRTSELAEANERLLGEVATRRRAEQEADAAKQAQAQFLASMSHEIRTPLNAIVGYSQILHRQFDDERMHDALEAILQSSDHLLTLVDDVLDLSKIESGQLSQQLVDFNLGRLVSNLSFMFRHKCQAKGLALEVEGLGEAPQWVRGDEGKLRQVLINLLDNAVKFTPNGEVRLRVIPEEELRFRFEIIDTGSGIAPEEQTRIFRNFIRGSHDDSEGTGLGLAIADRLVSLLGGKLELRSATGWGTNLYFTLSFVAPVAVAQSQTRASYPRLRLTADTVVRCLIVDDNPYNRQVLAEMLCAVGCSVRSTASGLQAIEAVDDFEADIAFIDVLMEGMDGIETRRRLVDKRPQLVGRTVAFSASVLEEQRDRCKRAGFDDFVSKPLRMARVNECLSALAGARFEAVDEGPASDVPLARLSLPEALVARLREAAELYQTTRLNASLVELGRLGQAESALARRLRRKARAYDMHGLLVELDALERHAPLGAQETEA